MSRGYRDEINEAFWAFHEANPQVYALFDRFTRELIGAGKAHGSSKLICERIRWETMVKTTDSGPVKLNNNFTSRYARLWEHHNRAHKGFFRQRALNPVSANTVRVPEHEARAQ
jgi:hypothetical protein